ncbi:MAG: FAD-dependent oxidoreductase [Candidatus Heimdallarchaeota archaeon]|nr:FAD-dependent oxidoreductase [Candidatus Heimdallarchaeota archaeon]MCK4954216.1 FAD-dependent oxidoreductase [Candidatus Heimdallarchaeota archaeon]
MMKIVIVGGVAGGASAAARLRRLDEFAEIIMLERGSYVSFASCGLPYYVGKVIKDRAKLEVVRPDVFLNRFNIDVRINNEALSIDRESKTLLVKDLLKDETYSLNYDILVLSPGAEPIIPPFKGIDEVPVFTLRTIPDTYKLEEFIAKEKPKKAVVVGGGFIGLEIAENLTEINISVTIVELMDQVMITIDREMAQYVHHELYRNDVDIVLGDGVESFSKTADGKTIVKTQSGKEIETDLVVLAIGVKPESQLAKDCDLELGPRGHIVVNKKMQTSDPSIYAVGDAVQVPHYITKEGIGVALAGPANKQGRIVAENIANRESQYDGVLAAAVVKVFDLTVSQVGLNEKQLKENNYEYEKIYLHPTNHASYYPGFSKLAIKLLFERNKGKVLGAQILGGEGTEKRIDVISTVMYFEGTVFDLEKLELTYAPPFGSAKDPANMAGFIASNVIRGDFRLYHWYDVKKLIEDGAYMIDVRRDDEFVKGSINGANHLSELVYRSRMEEIPKNEPVYLFCQEGFRAYITSRNLLQREYKVFNLTGGYKTYKMATASQEELKEMAKKPPFRIIF